MPWSTNRRRFPSTRGSARPTVTNDSFVRRKSEHRSLKTTRLSTTPPTRSCWPILEYLEPHGGERFEETHTCCRARIDNPERLVVLAQLGQSCLQQRHITLVRNLVNGHVTEPENFDANLVGRSVQRVNHFSIRTPELHGLVSSDLSGVWHSKLEVRRRNKQGSAVLADKRVSDAELLLDLFELGARLARTEHHRHFFACEFCQEVRGGCERTGGRISKYPIYFGEDQNRFAALHPVHINRRGRLYASGGHPILSGESMEVAAVH